MMMMMMIIIIIIIIIIKYAAYYGPFINYVKVSRVEGVRKISTYSYFWEGRIKPILT